MASLLRLVRPALGRRPEHDAVIRDVGLGGLHGPVLSQGLQASAIGSPVSAATALTRAAGTLPLWHADAAPHSGI